MFEVQNSFIKSAWLESQVNTGQLLLGNRQTSSPYSKTGKHFVLIRWKTTSSKAALSTLPNNVKIYVTSWVVKKFIYSYIYLL